jgi:hypothetical protein
MEFGRKIKIAEIKFMKNQKLQKNIKLISKMR